MANNTFLPTGFTVTSTFQSLAALLDAAGIPTGSGFTAGQDGYIRNNDDSINLDVGQGASAPTSFATVGPHAAVLFNAGLNPALIWLKSASSTVDVDYVEGATNYEPPLVNGVIGTLTATTNTVPKADADGNLVASSIIDDGTTVTASEPIISAHATTPYFETASGKTNTGYVNVKGKTSGSLKIKPADATGQVVTLATAAQTSGAATVTIPDLAGVSDTLAFTTLAQSLASKTLVSPVISTGLTASGSAANTFVGSTGTFITSSGANTLSGSVTVNDATTPSITLATGKTNTGFLQINGKTSGSTKFITADSTAQAVIISTAAQTTGGCTLTIPDQLGTSSNFVFSNQFLTAAIATPATNATNVMANLTALSLSLKASGTYSGTLVLKVSNSTAAEGVAVDLDGGNCTATTFAAGAGILTGGTTVTVTAVSSALATDFDWSTITGETWITFQITIVVNGAGTFIPRFRESTAHTSGTVTVAVGSYIALRMVA